MKKVLFAAMFLLGLSIMSVDCSKVSTDDFATAIVGRWKLYKVVYFNGEEEIDKGTTGEGSFLIFTESGQCIFEEDDVADRSSYRIDGHFLTLGSGGRSIQIVISRLTNNELVLQFDNEDISDFSKMYYKRVE